MPSSGPSPARQLGKQSASRACKKAPGQGGAAPWNRKGKSSEQGKPDWSCRASPGPCADGRPGVAVTCQRSPARSDPPLLCGSDSTRGRGRLLSPRRFELSTVQVALSPLPEVSNTHSTSFQLQVLATLCGGDEDRALVAHPARLLPASLGGLQRAPCQCHSTGAAAEQMQPAGVGGRPGPPPLLLSSTDTTRSAAHSVPG